MNETYNENITNAISEYLNAHKAEPCRRALVNYTTWNNDVVYVTLDALDKKDVTYGIAENSIYMSFKIEISTQKVEPWIYGRVYISDADKEVYPRDKYLAMHSMKNIVKRSGGKVMRKQGWKSVEDLCSKMLNEFYNTMKYVIDYTDGVYPYEKGVKMLKYAK